MRILLPAAPVKTVLTNSKGEPISDLQSSWDAASRTCYLGFDNDPDGIQVTLSW
jgi:hypothetical protein